MAKEDADSTRTIARAVRAARAYAGLSRDALGDSVELDGQTIGRYERGDWKEPPKGITLNAIADVCGVPREFMRNGWPDAAELFLAAAAAEAEQSRKRGQRAGEDPPAAGAGG